MARKTIIRGNPLVEEAILSESGSSASVKPGHVLKRARNATTDTVHGVAKADSNTSPHILVAIENTPEGMDVDGEYTAVGADSQIANSPAVLFAKVQRGDVVQLRLAASAVAVKYGDYLAVDDTNDGNVERTSTAANARFITLENVDNSSGTTEAFVKAEVV